MENIATKIFLKIQSNICPVFLSVMACVWFIGAGLGPAQGYRVGSSPGFHSFISVLYCVHENRAGGTYCLEEESGIPQGKGIFSKSAF